ncbi:hypothetical protein [Novosphingobium sp. EMRT-2]|uniref:hypothetical protein n=1 Tax=Novosphingobium sp. EMRT-2 TaxID=2571749 RepID=UPI0010BDD34A|nr:hypothetical protein [Novosphingobium sp. EMRT-2]QCI92491.1 hypothetical protein FA702_02260 [Novosphingobium sp. EMRT-2]
MAIARWPLLALFAACACTARGRHAANGHDGVPVRPGLWSVVALTDDGEDPASRTEACLAEQTWFAMAALTSGSREMGCEPLEAMLPRGPGAPVTGAREVCRQGSKTVVRTVSLDGVRPAGQPLVAFDEVTRLRVEGQPGEEISRTRHVWLGACPGPSGELLGLKAER